MFRPKGRKPDEKVDEYGLIKFGADRPDVDIYCEGYTKLEKEIASMMKNFRIYKYSSLLEIPFVISFNRGYLVESYFLKVIGKSPLVVDKPDQANAFVIPATPLMYYSLVQQIWNLWGLIRPSIDVNSEEIILKRRKWEGKLLLEALKKPLKSPYFQEGQNHVYFSSKLGTEFIEQVNEPIFKNGVLVVNSADAKRGYFNPQKDVSSVCMKDYKIPKYAYDIAAFDRSYEEREYYTYYAGMIYGQRGWVHEKRTENCLWIDRHVPFGEYLANYSRSKFYFHFPGSSEWSPRLFEGMWFGAVPVVLYDQYTLPFSDVLDWSKFAVLIHMDQIQETYAILEQITREEWQDKRAHLKVALKHFAYHKKPVFGDAFYMTMYSIYKRINSAGEHQKS